MLRTNGNNLETEIGTETGIVENVTQIVSETGIVVLERRGNGTIVTLIGIILAGQIVVEVNVPGIANTVRSLAGDPTGVTEITIVTIPANAMILIVLITDTNTQVSAVINIMIGIDAMETIWISRHVVLQHVIQSYETLPVPDPSPNHPHEVLPKNPSLHRMMFK